MKTPMRNAVFITAILFAVVTLSVTSSGCLQTPQVNPNINLNIVTTPTPAQEKIVDIVVNGQNIHVDIEGENKTVRIDEPGQAPIDVNVVNRKVNNSIQV
jgi:hypothetical protein